ncbi:MAG: hypothetical protein CFH01_00713 [Alphaproteobacteria bacterium MarineAlpha2_Bin1]|nr:MAG: hypothetical protein CFH01_00713 [Alphaproteobacteria bacterium MarineAlpha2_Bin1]|tara:strand:+ start:436 stop:717 length:282 start_codon:yes stop_codon:yes gene_type:complete
MINKISISAEQELEALNTAITDAISKVREGIYVSINHLETWCERICKSILELPSVESRKMASKLEIIVNDLDILKDLILRQLTAMKFKASKKK